MKDVLQPDMGVSRTAASRTVPGNTLDDFLCSLVDYIIAAIGLVALSIIFLVLALIVKLDSPGPVLYRRRVMGRGGTEFDAFKFRTMVVNGDEVLAAHAGLKAQWLRDQKLKDDPRVTRSGRWMRKLSFDEFPQLFNVLLGQMSLVGPRMISPPELARYGECASELLSVRPGITGLWQISGRSDLGRDDRVRLDLQYVRTRSVWLNLKLLVLTVPAVVLSKGAY
jgi:lipopolysaccharide/colanic/teichoic acid biosynthesis glycosyltransferase